MSGFHSRRFSYDSFLDFDAVLICWLKSISEELFPPSSGLKEFRLVGLIPLTMKME